MVGKLNSYDKRLFIEQGQFKTVGENNIQSPDLQS